MATDPSTERDVVSASEDRRIRALRPDKPEVDPWRPFGLEAERELLPGGEVVDSVTLFLVGAECPFTCIFCDLWRFTIEGATPVGALVRQIDLALDETTAARGAAQIKLYNASNFFDERAVPRQDWPAIAERLRPFERVVVECHPRLVGPPCAEFADLLEGELEVAMGLETVHPVALERLNKKMSCDHFDRAAAWLADAGIPTRAFVLVGTPWVAESEGLDWVVASARHAFGQGVGLVSLIPLRDGNGALEELIQAGEFTRSTLSKVEEALEGVMKAEEGTVQADTWDLERLVDCDRCGPRRIDRIRRMNLSGSVEAQVRCESCAR